MPHLTLIVGLIILLILVGGIVFLTQKEEPVLEPVEIEEMASPPQPQEEPVPEPSQSTPRVPAPQPQTQPTAPMTEEEPSPPPPTPIIEEFTVEADDAGLYPATIEVTRGSTVRLTFNVRSQGTYFGGLDFRSSVWGDTGKVAPGASKTVEFTASETFEYRSYWPSSGVLKAVGQIKVK